MQPNLMTQSIIGSESLIGLFEASVKFNPNKIAIFHNDQSISYEDLNQQVNAITNRLFELGIKKDNIITILLERSISLTAAILAVLKTGAAYVVVDPDYPISRIEYILKDTNSSLLLTEKTYHDNPKYKNLLGSHSSQHLFISPFFKDAPNYTIANPIIQSNGDTLACILYTSGSTGKPKGVLLDHKAFFRLFNGPAMVQASSSDCVSQTSNASFDAAIYEMWAALGKGGSLVIIDKDTVLSPQALEKCFKEYNITTAFLTTGLFNQLAKITPTIFRSLKNALCAGESANAEIMRKILNNTAFRPQRLFNLYGPTECAVFATYYEIKTLDDDATSVPIGMPVNDTQLYILNDNLEKVQPGEVGELYISGEGVARGYLNLPALTTEKFILCPFDVDRKMYKTGDLVRSLPNGLIDFVGRKDNQVKIRGFRVELEEVECVLESHPNIFQGVVVAPYTQQGHQQLVAYFTLKNAKITIKVDSLKLHLQKTLPDYMIPAAFVQLDSLPLTSHGKIDRQALSNLPLSQQIEDNEVVLDLTNTEKLFLTIWKNILGNDKIKPNDNFFNLGGDSIMIIQMLAQAAEHRIILKYSLVLQHPTIKSLAYLIEDGDHEVRKEFLVDTYLNGSEIQNKHNGKSLNTDIDLGLTEYSFQEFNEIVPDIKDVQAVYPLTPIQEGFLFHAIYESKSCAYFIQTHWRSKGKYNPKAMCEAWAALINNHELLRASYLWEELKYPIQIIYKQAKIAFQEEDWKVFSPEEQEAKLNEYFVNDRELGVDFKKPPFMRFAVIQLSEYEQLMIWSFQHIIMDGPSLFKLIEELDYYYSTLCSGNKIVLKQMPLFRDYIVWQKKQNQDVNRLFWENYLQGFTFPNQIGFHPSCHLDALSCHSCQKPLNYKLSEELSQLLHEYARQNQLTLNAVMQGIWAYLLSSYCNTIDVVFGLTVSIRPSGISNVHSIVGPLIDTLPFRVIVDKDAVLLEYFKKIQANLAAVMDHSFYPYIDIRKGVQVSVGEALFNSSFCFESKQFEDIKEGLSSFYDINFNAMTHYPLSIYIVAEKCVKFKVNFNAYLYAENNIDRLINNYISLLSELTKKNSVSLKELTCFELEEFKQIRNDCTFMSRQLTESIGPPIQAIEKQIHSQLEMPGKLRLSHKQIEEQITDIWSDILHNTTIGIDDNFFEIGGDSLLAIRLVSRLHKELQMEVTIRNLFDAPTISQLSEFLSECKDLV